MPLTRFASWPSPRVQAKLLDALAAGPKQINYSGRLVVARVLKEVSLGISFGVIGDAIEGMA